MSGVRVVGGMDREVYADNPATTLVIAAQATYLH
jgi:hypothetical protein